MPTPKRVVRKTLRISQEKLERARRMLGTKTDAETVEAALDMLLFQEKVQEGVRRMAGSNRIRDIDAEDEDANGVHPGHEPVRRRQPQSRGGPQPVGVL